MNPFATPKVGNREGSHGNYRENKVLIKEEEKRN
jgi:hypothetical protein